MVSLDTLLVCLHLDIDFLLKTNLISSVHSISSDEDTSESESEGKYHVFYGKLQLIERSSSTYVCRRGGQRRRKKSRWYILSRVDLIGRTRTDHFSTAAAPRSNHASVSVRTRNSARSTTTTTTFLASVGALGSPGSPANLAEMLHALRLEFPDVAVTSGGADVAHSRQLRAHATHEGVRQRSSSRVPDTHQAAHAEFTSTASTSAPAPSDPLASYALPASSSSAPEPVSKKWYVVTTGRQTGVFDNWYVHLTHGTNHI